MATATGVIKLNNVPIDIGGLYHIKYWVGDDRYPTDYLIMVDAVDLVNKSLHSPKRMHLRIHTIEYGVVAYHFDRIKTIVPF